ncbi:dimethylarginine dimethylaminohydrolase family protein [Chitinophaga deserti]|uniref:dimethylarginine dimethylaminohydrolase family protein n=1 Tax=Chitinophaga deserti TaxID=2164099 RepID=UPI000D6C238B|nr:arginine deiminase family protein [Chitinophaga deserti]
MIFVSSEFAPLQTVVLAESEFAFPEIPRPEDLRFLPDTAITEVLENKGKNYADAFPDSQRAWEGERAALGKVLEKYNVKILRPRKLTEAEKAAGGPDGYSNFFARDPFFTIGNYVIEGSMRFLHRRNEILPLRNIFRDHVYPEECRYVATPRPEIAAANDATLGPGPFLEGGDVLVLDKKIFVGYSGLASNPTGAAWLRKLLAPEGYDVETVRLHPNILHLDCALGLIRNGLMLVCEEAFPDGIPQSLQHWQRIPVSLSEAALLATNGLPVNPDVYITDPEFSKFGEQIAAHGVKVEYIDFRISRSFGGSFRCSTQPLLRK